MVRKEGVAKNKVFTRARGACEAGLAGLAGLD